LTRIFNVTKKCPWDAHFLHAVHAVAQASRREFASVFADANGGAHKLRARILAVEKPSAKRRRSRVQTAKIDLTRANRCR
jgi:hypothetical protein